MRRALGALAALCFVTSAFAADDYPSQPIRIIVGFSAGSTTDILARTVAAKLIESWGKPAVVENRPGAGGVVAAQALLSAPADGHALMVVSAGHAVSAALYKNLPYDTERDFSGVTMLATVPSILVVPLDSPVKSVKDLLAYARAKPGAYNYSSPGIGSANHLGGALFASLGGLQVQHVPYKGIPQALLSAPADGHTLMVVSAGHAVSAALYKNLPYDTERDFSGVTMLATVPSILVVANDSPVKSVKELLAYARAKPGAFNYSSPGIGSANHLGGALFASLGGLQVQHVPYKGIPQALQAAMTGEVLFNLSPIVNVLPAASGGKVRALATSTSKRALAMPDLPTVAEAGLPGYSFDPWFGLLTSAKTPRPVVAKLNAEVRRILGLPEVKKQLLAMGAEPTPIAPEAFDSAIRAEIAKFSKVVHDANIKVE
jgi:tripartite-type tricarboxylate transporter receptor subunit TctC